jgi:hypothetical protein
VQTIFLVDKADGFLACLLFLDYSLDLMNIFFVS